MVAGTQKADMVDEFCEEVENKYEKLAFRN